MVVGDLATGTDLLIIGAGPGGYVAAIRAAQLGKDVTLVEKSELGGVCLNIGCIPSKALIHAADEFYKIKKADAMGIIVKDVKIEPEKLQKWKSTIVKTLTSGIGMLCNKNKITVIKGDAFFQSPTMVKILVENGFKNIEFQNAIIATGSEPVEIPAFKFDHKIIINSTDALALKKVPKNLVVIGGGYIGLELGTAYAKLGSNVSVVELGNQLLPGQDNDVVTILQRRLEKLGVKIYLGHKAEKCEVKENSAEITISKNGNKVSLDADNVLVAVGRKISLSSLKLENTQVELDAKGFIKIDNQMRTTERRIFAVGDVTGNPMLAHKASKQGKVAAEVIAGQQSSFDNIVVPVVVFTDPEIAIAGLTENDAKAQDKEITIGKFPFAALGRALTVNETEGFVKIISEKQSGLIMGITIIGHNASDVIGEAILAIEMGATLDDLELIIHPHPTFTESLMEAAEVAKGHAIHIFSGK